MNRKNQLIIILLIFILIIMIVRKNKKKNFTKTYMKNGKVVVYTKRRIPLKKYKDAEKLGKMYINSYIKKVKTLPDHSAVMFDIDDTLLYVPTRNNGNLTLIKPMKNLLDFCISKGLLVIIITARASEHRKYTIDELNKHGINYSSLYLHEIHPDETSEEFNNFKSNIKKYLFQKYKIKIIMSVGDNNIDVIGKYSGYGLKLPNKNDPALYEVYPDSSQLTKFG